CAILRMSLRVVLSETATGNKEQSALVKMRSPQKGRPAGRGGHSTVHYFSGARCADVCVPIAGRSTRGARTSAIPAMASVRESAGMIFQDRRDAGRVLARIILEMREWKDAL